MLTENLVSNPENTNLETDEMIRLTGKIFNQEQTDNVLLQYNETVLCSKTGETFSNKEKGFELLVTKFLSQLQVTAKTG